MDHLFCVFTCKVIQNPHCIVCVFNINVNDPLHMLLDHEKIMTHLYYLFEPISFGIYLQG